MVIDPFYDTIIAVTLICTSLKVMIDKCLNKTRNKIIVTKDNNINKKSIKNTQSFSKLNFIEIKEVESYPENPVELLECCFQCKHKFINYNYEPSYYAHDKRFCKFCWSSLEKNVLSNHL